MAQIINKSNHLRKELMIEYMKLIGCFLAAIFCTVLAFFYIWIFVDCCADTGHIL